MSSASSPRSYPAADPEIAQLSEDPADEDANAAPTKVGPMSKAFVDQMMFKAQLAESQPPSRVPMTDPPASGERARATSAATPATRPASAVVVLNANEEGLPFEPTQPAAAAARPTPPPALAFPVPAFPPPAFDATNEARIAEFARPIARRRKSTQRLALEIAILTSGLALMIAAVVLWLVR